MKILEIKEIDGNTQIKTDEVGLGSLVINDRRHKHTEGVFFVEGKIKSDIYYKTPGEKAVVIKEFVGDKPKKRLETSSFFNTNIVNKANQANDKKEAEVARQKIKEDIEKQNKSVEDISMIVKKHQLELEGKTQETSTQVSKFGMHVYENTKEIDKLKDQNTNVFKKIETNTRNAFNDKIELDSNIKEIRTDLVQMGKSMEDQDEEHREDVRDVKEAFEGGISKIEKETKEVKEDLSNTIKDGLQTLGDTVAEKHETKTKVKALVDDLSVSININTENISNNTVDIGKNEKAIKENEKEIDKIHGKAGVNYKDGEITANIDKDTVVLSGDKIAVNLDKFYTKEEVRKNIEANMSGGAVVRGGSPAVAYKIKTDTTNFDNVLSSDDDTVQKALDTLDNSGGGAGPLDTTNFDGILSSADDTIQKAFDTIDDYDPVLPYDAMTDPAVDSALTTAKLDAYSGTTITTTTTGNDQTFGSPTDTTAGRTFVIINNDTSTNSFDVVDATKTITIQPGTAQKYVWDGTVRVAVEAVDAGDITNIPSGDIVATNVQDAVNELDAEKASLAFSIAMAVAL